MAFQDHFSRQAGDYGRYRPGYPPELAAHLAALAPSRALALDLATGNGQAAIELAAHFERVLASDPSAEQLAHAEPHPRVCYLRHAAERLPVAAGVADLVVAAQAAHWFDLPRFYAEARRVLKPAGLVALWTCEKPRVDAPVDRALDTFYADVVGRYWPPERRFVEAGYRNLPFPLEELPAPRFALLADWPLERMLGYVGTWSAVGRYRAVEGRDPLPLIAAALAPFWAAGGVRRVTWQIHLRLGRVTPI